MNGALRIIDTLDCDRYGQEIAAAWIGKEKLRDALNLRARVTGSTPCERQVRDRVFCFYDWCAQHDDIPELITLARTVSRWDPLNQRRRVRIACTSGYRRRARAATNSQTRTVTGQKLHPG